MRMLSYFFVAAFSGSLGAAMMALLIAGAKQDREMEHCATCQHYPQPDGIAHLCDYWQKLTNERGFCSNWRGKDGT